MHKKLLGLMLLAALVCGCSERTMQKGVLGMSDPALATRQDIESMKKLINERFDRLENLKSKSL